jgi:hypothetical protein
MPAKKKEMEQTELLVERKGGSSPYIETNLDRFYNTIKEKKTLSFIEAQKEFGKSREQIASWAKIIEEHNLAKVHYPIFGSPVIMFSEETKPKKEKEKRPAGKKAPKIVVALVGGLLIFAGYVMVINNPFTISMRSQLSSLFGRIAIPFLPSPLNIIMPFAVIAAVVWAFFGMKRKRKPKGGS